MVLFEERILVGIRRDVGGRGRFVGHATCSITSHRLVRAIARDVARLFTLVTIATTASAATTAKTSTFNKKYVYLYDSYKT